MKDTLMKEIKYTSKRYRPEVLSYGAFKNYEYKITHCGNHPCAYVKLPDNHRYYNKSYDNIPISCHGGLTYSSFEDDNMYWIGWDYAHYGDLIGIDLEYLDVNNPYFCKRMWSIREITQDVQDVINQLIELE